MLGFCRHGNEGVREKSHLVLIAHFVSAFYGLMRFIFRVTDFVKEREREVP